MSVRLVTYVDESSKWRLRAEAANNRTLADSGQGYEDRAVMFDALHLLWPGLQEADVETR